VRRCVEHLAREIGHRDMYIVAVFEPFRWSDLAEPLQD
jgi:hypothetical protein